ncbi:YciI family protein [Gandjariella thermophila]|uniref:YCII-related domain-containing protein n=1 Tax=Gandjariella thermophila TaxID=1931992 RepID=A0A4D4JDX5_9PSEU|nr:muconolactone Delta-isomerase family protein [Gandjariella thermophila]GDY32103.1 hypothetical protein GTS_37360 [Gandjariella thermophila]
MATFAVELCYGRDTAEQERVRPEHRAYLRQLAERGVVLASGPFPDENGGLVIYQVADEAELRAVLADDPFSKAGVIVRTTVRQWNPLFGTWIS